MVNTQPAQTTSYTYDGLNRLLSVTSPQGVVQYQYDVLGRRNPIQFGPNTANLKQVNYGYDGLSRPVTMTNWASQPVNYSYNGARLSALSYPNGVTATFSFDGAERLTRIIHTKGITNLFSAAYSLDRRGNRTAISENINGSNRNLNYQYDELSRLTSEGSQVGAAVAISSTYVLWENF